MQRRFFMLLALLVAAPAFVQANTVSLQGSAGGVLNLLENTPGQVITLLLSGSDSYSSSDLFTQINGGSGNAPFVTAIFGDVGGPVGPPSLLNGTIWQGGSAGILSDPNGVSPSSSGLLASAGMATGAFFPQTTNGIYATLTISTVGVAGGSYPLTFNGTIMTFSPEDGSGNDTPVDISFAPMTLVVPGVPEPSSIVLGLFAAAGLATVAIRRRRTA